MEKKFLFVTEDGVNIYQGDKYYTLAVKEHETHEGMRRFFKDKFNTDIPLTKPAGSIVGPYINPKWDENSGILKYFAKRENAEKYALTLE